MQTNLHLLYLVFLPPRLGKSLWNESKNVSSCSAEVGLSDSCITKKPGFIVLIILMKITVGHCLIRVRKQRDAISNTKGLRA